jgi:hypothetical protein
MFQWPLQKIDVINFALSQTGDNLVAVADDGSDEWNAASPSYEDALASMIEDHPWNWTTEMRVLQPAGNAPSDVKFDTAYNIPSDMVHLILVRIIDRPCVWDILDNQIVVNAQGGPPPPVPPTAPAKVTIKGVFSTNADPTFATPLFVSALKRFVMAGIYRGLHEDATLAKETASEAHSILSRAKARHDMEKPKRKIFNSRMTWRRRVRSPWPQYPGGWGGNGWPG